MKNALPLWYGNSPSCRKCERPRGARLAHGLREPVAEAAHRLDHVLAVERLEQLPQAADMHVDGAMTGLDVLRPSAAQELVAAKNAPLVFEKERK
jgi:hypothetical protein